MTLFEEIIEDLKAYEPDSPYENITDRLLAYLHKQHIRRLGKRKRTPVLLIDDTLKELDAAIKSAKEGW